MRRRHGWIGLSLLLLPLLAHAPAAYGASTAASPGDPPAGSPSGSVYQLPFEKGRADAAPKGSGGTSATGPGGGGGGGGGATGSEGSYYRSENNFGSASRVPGAPVGGSGAGQSTGGGSAAHGGVGGSGGGTGGETGSGGGAGASSGVNASEVTDSGNTSSATNIILLAAIGLIAIGVGVVGARANRLRAQR
jgi:hypothetical protein